MKFLKAILVIVLVLVVGYAAACFFGPKRMEISVSESMAASPETVYAHVATLPTWEKWNTYSQMEGIETTYGEKQEGKGASYSWEMKGEPGGNLEIVEAYPSDSLRVRLQFEGWDGYSFVDYTFQPQGDSTKVSWKMTNDNDTPFYLRGMMWFMEGSMKKDFKKSLQNLEELSESTPANLGPEYTAQLMDRPAANYLGIRRELPIDSLESFYGNSYGKIMAYMEANQYEIVGAPVGIYYKWDTENSRADLAAAIPVSGENLQGNDMVELIQMPEGKAAVFQYYGSYENLTEPHEAMWKYMEENSLEEGGPVIEEYITDPMNEPDTTKWQTNVVYYVK